MVILSPSGTRNQYRHPLSQAWERGKGGEGRRAIVALLCLLSATVSARAESQIKQIKLLVRAGDPDVVSVAELKKIAPDFDGKTFVLTTSDAVTPEEDAKATEFRPLPSQADDLDGDGTPDEIAFTVEPNTRIRRVVTLSYGPESAIAPLRTPWPKRAHALYAKKYEGMGWESDRVAWRIYFDQRNAIDIYGKKQHGLALDYFAAPGVNYHAESPIGRDIFKNGDTLGLGSIGAVVDGKVVKVSDVDERTWRVVADGPVRAIADLHYKGWKVGGRSVDLTSRLTIWAGQHGFEHRIFAKNADGLTLVTGLPKKPNVEVMVSPAPRMGKAYLATWGKQVLIQGTTAVDALPDQNMGLAIIIPVPNGGKVPLGPPNASDTLFQVNLDKNGSARYLVVGAWDQEAPDDNPPFRVRFDPALMIPAAVQSAQAWERYVDSIPGDEPIVHIVSRRATAAAPPPDAADPNAARKTYAEAIALMRGDIDRTAQKVSAGVSARVASTTPTAPTKGPNFFEARSNQTGAWQERPVVGWTGSFWTAQLWKMYGYSKDPKYLAWGRLWNDSILGQEPRQSHDTGFINYYGSALGYEATKDPKYRAGAIRSADRLKQLFNPKTGLVAAWNVGGEDSIIDTMMNLQILWWAAKETKDNSYREVGRQHALKSAEWLVRPDGSVVQSVHYDPATGRLRFGHTHQGFGDDTSWARGTGWALYGFGLAAQATGDPKLLATAEKIAAFVRKRMPDDGITWHDYADEGVYFRTKDTSAAALAANGFLLLSELTKDKTKAAAYRAAGQRIVDTLIDHYLTPTGPTDTVIPTGVLRHASAIRPADHGLIFGDYYLLEALLWLEGRGMKRG
jgi:unsaturated chondroitin disaccharide hydrolase